MKNFEFWEGWKRKNFLNAVGFGVGVAPFSVGPLQGSTEHQHLADLPLARPVLG